MSNKNKNDMYSILSTFTRLDSQTQKLDESKKVKNPYAVGMSAAMKSTGDKPPLKKSTIKKAHEIARKIDETKSKLEAIKHDKEMAEHKCPDCNCKQCKCGDKDKTDLLGETEEKECPTCKCDPCECDDEMDEGNAFTGKLANTKHGDEFELGGRKYKDTSSLEESNCSECGMSESVCECGTEYSREVYENYSSYALDSQQDNISVNTSYSSRDKRKTVTVTADGECAEELMSLLKLSGLCAPDSVKSEPAHAVVVAQEAKEYGDTEVETAPEHANKPKPKYASVDAITKAGADLHKRKKQYADKPKSGDNPMATESLDLLKSLGKDLIKIYKGIQK